MCEVLAAIIARKWVVAEASVEREVFTVLRFAMSILIRWKVPDDLLIATSPGPFGLCISMSLAYEIEKKSELMHFKYLPTR